MYIELPRRSLSRLALVLLLASNGPAWCQAATKESPWSNTGLDLSYFRGKVTTPGCHRSETRFLACISAIQAILDHHGDGLRLRHSTWSDTKPSSDRPYKQFGELRIVRVPVYRGTDIVEHLKEARQHRGRVQAWRTVYQNIGDARVDFTAVRDWVVSDLVEGDRIEEYAAVAINGYIGAEDAHARLVPAADLYEGPKASKESYTGIGVALQEIGGAVMIGEVIRGGPAFEAGLRPYDLILTLDDSPVQRQALEEVTASLRGSQGSAVELKVSRRNREFRVNVIREQVQVKTVTASVLTDRAIDGVICVSKTSWPVIPAGTSRSSWHHFWHNGLQASSWICATTWGDSSTSPFASQTCSSGRDAPSSRCSPWASAGGARFSGLGDGG